MPATRNAVRFETVADLLEQLGGIDPRRVRLNPPPGKATEEDLLRILARTNRPYELVDGVLVEKVMGFAESYLACDLIALLHVFVLQHDLGFLTGEVGTMRLMAGLVRIPDIAFVSWKRMGKHERPTEAIPDLVPDLAVEVLGEGNTPKEMERKLKEYFLAGVVQVWFVDPTKRSVEVFTAPDQSRMYTEQDTLDGGDVLPALNLAVRQVFALTPPQPGRKRGARRQGKPGRGNSKS